MALFGWKSQMLIHERNAMHLMCLRPCPCHCPLLLCPGPDPVLDESNRISVRNGMIHLVFLSRGRIYFIFFSPAFCCLLWGFRTCTCTCTLQIGRKYAFWVYCTLYCISGKMKRKYDMGDETTRDETRWDEVQRRIGRKEETRKGRGKEKLFVPQAKLCRVGIISPPIIFIDEWLL